jgi:hypothetical protein
MSNLRIHSRTYSAAKRRASSQEPESPDQQGRRSRFYYTRSRPYRSNDNAHIEQKNWTHVRQWFG